MASIRGGKVAMMIYGSYLGNSNSTILYRHNLNSTGSRSLLAAPAVKDSTKTMRVTYQFDYS